MVLSGCHDPMAILFDDIRLFKDSYLMDPYGILTWIPMEKHLIELSGPF